MKNKDPISDPKNDLSNEITVLRLYITGASMNSSKAVTNVKLICEQYLKDRYQLEVIDVYQEGVLASKEQIVALPLLVKLSPLPERRLIGDMSNTEKVLKGLGIITT